MSIPGCSTCQHIAPEDRPQPGASRPAAGLSERVLTPEGTFPVSRAPEMQHQTTSTGVPPDAHNLADSCTAPILNLSPYFSKTDWLWYFQNCLDASLPAMRFRILVPPGCSSTNSGGMSVGHLWRLWRPWEGR